MTSVVSSDVKSMRFTCAVCQYSCMRRNDLQKHLGTQKHARALKGVTGSCPVQPSSAPLTLTYDCLCGKAYRHPTSLYKHRRGCNLYQSEILNVCMDPVVDPVADPVVDPVTGSGLDPVTSSGIDPSSTSLLISLLSEQTKCNNELKNMIEQQGKQFMEVVAKVDSTCATKHTTTINNTTKFNLNVFLNSECKDAMNVMDFVQMIEVTPEDLDRLADVGYVEGVARLMMDGLRKLDVCQRPIHCTDVKRESFYIKDNNVWEKDNSSGDKMHRVVKHVAHQNVIALPKWQKENPTHSDFTTRTHEQYLRIVNAAFGGSTQDEINHFRNKIIRKAAPELVAPKKSLRDKDDNVGTA